jgi:uncharacterized protein YbaP (TraB family)
MLSVLQNRTWPIARRVRGLGFMALAVLTLACFVGPARGQQPVASVSARKAADTPSRNPLWVIENGKSKTYLLGTIHLMSAKSYPLSEAIEKAYSESDIVVFESDMRAINRADTQVRLTQGGTYPAGRTLRKSVSSATYARFEKRCAAAGLPVRQMDRFKPWFCGITFTMLEIRKLGFDFEYGPEQYFYRRARKDGKKPDYFESIDEHFRLFTGLSKKEDEQLFLQTLDALDLVKRDAAGIVQRWKTGDLDGLTLNMLDSFKTRPLLRKRVLGDRNRKWMPKIEERIKKGQTTLIVVGVAHLLGDQGLIELLKKTGQAVRQL